VGQNRREQPAVRYSGAYISGRQAHGAHHVDRHREQLGVGGNGCFTDDVDVELEMLTQAAALLPLVAEQLRHREPADRLPERARSGRDHPRKSRRHFRPQRDLAAALVGESVELTDDLLAALFCVELERLQRRSIVLDESIPARHIPPDFCQVIAGRELLGIEITESG
jgi:hypothetical protein